MVVAVPIDADSIEHCRRRFFCNRCLWFSLSTIQSGLVSESVNRMGSRLKFKDRGLHADDASLGTVDIPQRVVSDFTIAAFPHRWISILASDTEPEINEVMSQLVMPLAPISVDA